VAVKSICGVIVAARDPRALASFYAEALGLAFEREDHGGLDEHFGVDIGRVHFGIHPPKNLHRDAVGNAAVNLTFDVQSLQDVASRLRRLGARELAAPHDEGFGVVAAYADPEGNVFEIVELRYEFKDG
jgi:predicted enzyme related to lactoylglutathione lyase